MDLKIAARMIVVLALGAVMTLAVMALRKDGAEVPPTSRLHNPGGEPPPLSREGAGLAHCRDKGAAALDDPACKTDWAESRRRFLRPREEPRP